MASYDKKKRFFSPLAPVIATLSGLFAASFFQTSAFRGLFDSCQQYDQHLKNYMGSFSLFSDPNPKNWYESFLFRTLFFLSFTPVLKSFARWFSFSRFRFFF